MKTRALVIAIAMIVPVMVVAQSLTPPSNVRFGTKSTDSDSDSDTPDPTPVPVVRECKPSGDAPRHAYFNQMVSRADCLAGFSLRSQAQLDGLVKVAPSRYFRYDAAKDAAQLYKPKDDKPIGTTESVPGNQTLRFPLQLSSGSVVLTWDFWWGPEFRTNIGKLDVYKSFRVLSGDNPNDTKIFWSMNDGFVWAQAADDVAIHQEDLGDGTRLAPAVVSEKPFTPTGAGAMPTRTFPTKMARWTRYWVEIRFDVPGEQFVEWRNQYLGGAPLPGTWMMVSMWIADEQRAPTRIVYRAPVQRVGAMLTDFRFLFNTSTNAPALDGPLIAYGRNLVILRNALLNESDQSVFQKPIP